MLPNAEKELLYKKGATSHMKTESSGRGSLKTRKNARLVLSSVRVSGEDVQTRPVRASNKNVKWYR